MRLKTLIRIASDSYPDGAVAEAFAGRDPGDGLARFIATELAETYEPEMNSDWHLERAIEVMEKAHQELGAVLSGLRRRRERMPA